MFSLSIFMEFVQFTGFVLIPDQDQLRCSTETHFISNQWHFLNPATVMQLLNPAQVKPGFKFPDRQTFSHVFFPSPTVHRQWEGAMAQ